MFSKEQYKTLIEEVQELERLQKLYYKDIRNLEGKVGYVNKSLFTYKGLLDRMREVCEHDNITFGICNTCESKLFTA